MLQDSLQEGRLGPGSNLSTHMVQEVLVAHHSNTQLRLDAAGPHPIRYFLPIGPGPLDDCATDGGCFFFLNSCVNSPVHKLIELMFVGSEIPYTIMAKNRYCTSAVLWCRGFLTRQDGHKVNPSQKPLLQLEFLLRVCHQGGWVVDLCCGSGSGLIAGLRLLYNVAGFDILESQVNATKARIRKFAEQEVCSSKQMTQMLVKSLFAGWVEPLLLSPVESLLTYLVIAFEGRCFPDTP